jgi:hypothetical protein
MHWRLHLEIKLVYTCSHTCDFIPNKFTTLHLANGRKQGSDLLLQAIESNI